jgi:processive 1,2-diacylglycerol beta-glucosyltransferase
MARRRIHILYESAKDHSPHGSAYIRLLRPFKHPNLEANLEVTSGLRYEGQAVDAVIVDRLWRADVTAALVEELVDSVRRAGAKLIYALDDNLLDLPARRILLLAETEPWPSEEHRWIVRYLMRHADGVLVTTPGLKERLRELNEKIAVIPQALDERLLVRKGSQEGTPLFGRRKIVIGYMGTFTHDDDLLMVLPALQAVWERYGEEIEFQVMGVVGQPDTVTALEGLPIHTVNPEHEEGEYPLFMLWFTSRIDWDIAISPLRDTAFNASKSDIKFLDYCAVGAAGIYSRVPAYASSLRHMETGWLAENDTEAWTEALATLIADDELRRHVARQATEYLYGERILAQCADRWLSALDGLLDGA